MNDRYLGHSDAEKDLGIMISMNLTWSCQAERSFGKATQAFQMIKRKISAKQNELVVEKKQLYRSYILPIISYGSVLWKPSKDDLKLVEKVQHRMTTWILGTSRVD